MKIAYIGIKGFPSKGGTERVVEAIVKHLKGQHEITVYCDWRYTPPGTRIEGVRLVRIPTLTGKHVRAASLFCLCALHAVLLGNYDLIHLNGVESSFILPFLRLRYRVVSTSHGSPTRNRREKWGRFAQSFMERMEYPFLYLSNYAVSVSQADARYYEARYHKRAIYIPNGVDENIWADVPLARLELKKYGLQPGGYLLFCAGRIDPTKGCHLAIQAYQQVKPDCPLVVVGDLNQLPSYSDSLRQMAADAPIIFIPLITNKGLLFGIVKQCKFFIFSSLSEGMSMMLLEAASLGVPIIASDIPDNLEATRDCVLYFKSGDAGDLAEKLQYALNQPDSMAAFGEKARESILQNLPWQKVAHCYDTLYHACAGRQAVPYPELGWR